MQVNIPIIHGSSKCVRFFASLTIFYPKKPTVLRQKKNDIFGILIQVLRPVWDSKLTHQKKWNIHSAPKHSATLVGILSKIPTLLGRSKVGNSLASVQAWKKAMSSVVHLQGVGVFFFFFGKLTEKNAELEAPLYKMDVSENSGKTPPKSSHFGHRVFYYYKPSILGCFPIFGNTQI